MKVEFIQFQAYLMLSKAEIPSNVIKARGVLVHEKHDGPFGEISNESNEVTRDAYRKCRYRTENIRVNKFKWADKILIQRMLEKENDNFFQ